MKVLVGYDGIHKKDIDNHDIYTVKTVAHHIDKSPSIITTNKNPATHIMYTLEPSYKEKFFSYFVLISHQIPCDIHSPNTSINQKYDENFTLKSFDETLSPVPWLFKHNNNDDDQWAFVTDGMLDLRDSVIQPGTAWLPHSNYRRKTIAQKSKFQLQNPLENSQLLKKISEFTKDYKYYLETLDYSIQTKVAYNYFHGTNDATMWTIESQLAKDTSPKSFIQVLRDDGKDADFDVGLEKSNSVTGSEKYEMHNAVKALMSENHYKTKNTQSSLQALRAKLKIIEDMHRYSEIQKHDHSLPNYPAVKRFMNQVLRQHSKHKESSKPQYLIYLDAYTTAVGVFVAAAAAAKKNLHTFHGISDTVQVKDRKYAILNSLAINKKPKMSIDPKHDHSAYVFATPQSKDTNNSVVVVDYEKEKHIEAQKVSKGILNIDDDNSGDYHAYVNHAISVNNHNNYRIPVRKPHRIENESKPKTKISFQDYGHHDSITCIESLGQGMQELIPNTSCVHVPIEQSKVCDKVAQFKASLVPKKQKMSVSIPQPKVHHIPKEQEVPTSQPKVHHIPKEQEVPSSQPKIHHIPKEQEVPTSQPKVHHIPKEQEVPSSQPKIHHIPKEQEVPTSQPKVHHIPKEKEVRIPTSQPKVHHISKEKEVPTSQPKVHHISKKQEVPIPQPKVHHIPKEQEVSIPQPKVHHIPKEQEVSIPQPKVHHIPKEQEVSIPQPKVHRISEEQEVAHTQREQEVSIVQPRVYLVPKKQDIFTAQQPKVILSQPAKCVYKNFQCPIAISIMMADITTCSGTLLPLSVHSAVEQCMGTKLQNTTLSNSSRYTNTNDCFITADTAGQKQITQNVCKLDKEQCFTSAQSLCSSSLETSAILTNQQCELLDNINGSGDYALISIQSSCTKQFVGKYGETSFTVIQCLNQNCLVEVSTSCKEEGYISYTEPTCASSITALQIKSHASCGEKNFQHNEECSTKRLQGQQSHPENCNAKPLHHEQLSSHVHSLQCIALTYHPMANTCYQSKEQETKKQKPSVTPTKSNTQCQMLDGCCIQNTSCDYVPSDPCRDHATTTIDVNGLLTDNSGSADGIRTQNAEIHSQHDDKDNKIQDKATNLVVKLQNPSMHGKVADCHMTSKPHAVITGYRGFYAYGVFFHSSEHCAIKTLLRFIQINTKYSPFTKTTGLRRYTDCALQCTIPHTLIPRYTIDKRTQLMDKDYKKVYRVPPAANCNQDCHAIQCLKPFLSSCHVIPTTQLLKSHKVAGNICNEAEELSPDMFSQDVVDTNSSCLMTEIDSVCVVNSPCVQEQKIQQKRFTRLKVCIKKGELIKTYQKTFTDDIDVKTSEYSNTNSCHEKVPDGQQHKKIPPKFTPPIPPLHLKEMKYNMRTQDLFMQPQRHIVRCGKSKLQRYSTLKDYTDYRGRPPNYDHNATDCQPISITREIDISTNYWITQNGLTAGKTNGKQCASNTGNGQNSGNNTANGSGGKRTHGARFTGDSIGSSSGIYNNGNSKEGNNNDDDDDDDGNDDNDRDDVNDDNGHTYGEESRDINTTQSLTQEDVSADQNLPTSAPNHLINDENRIYDTGGPSIVENFPAEFSAVQPTNLQPQYFDYVADNYSENVNAEQETIEQPRHDDHIVSDDPVTEQESIMTEVSNHSNS